VRYLHDEGLDVMTDQEWRWFVSVCLSGVSALN
jgi:hypothetical protein